MEKINIAEILKDCPTCMELDCTMFDNVTFVRVDNNREQFPIEIAVGGVRSKYLTKEGCFHDTMLLPEAKCVIFPKGKTTWKGFQRPFKDGDILTNKTGKPFILKAYLPEIDNVLSYCGIDNYDVFQKGSNNWTFAKSVRFATEEEKEKLFKAIKDNGYKWNAETKTLEKLKKEKFDITTLKPFDKVLVRDALERVWQIQLFERYEKELIYPFICIGSNPYAQCIPYDGNQHLLGKTDDCDEYYKTWKL